jgi:hypothetical protein
MYSFGMSNVAILKTGKSRSISAENPTGEVGGGGKESSKIGKGRKGRPSITLPQGKETILADISGAGLINSFWITCPEKNGKCFYVLRDLVFRMYWDNSPFPSVEVPLGDFFCCGFGERAKINALPLAVNPTGGMNCFFPMPFRKGAKITIENQCATDLPDFFFQINYTLDDVPDNAAYFHAQWRRENITTPKKDFIILDGVSGKGHYMGAYLAWNTLGRSWWGEGELKFFIDGDKDYPTICGTGTEDYFGGAWCFYETHNGVTDEVTYSTAFMGHPYYEKPRHGLYRFHVMDPIVFDSDIRVTVQQIGYGPAGLFERTDDVSSVAYWYQDKPYGKFPKLPPAEERWPR